MSKKTLGLILILLALTVILIFVAISTKQQTPTQPTSNSQTLTPTPTLAPGHTSLSLSPDPVTITGAGSNSATVNVLIDTGGDQVRSVQLEIAYDPKAITNVSLKPGTFFTSPNVLPIGGVNASTGRITYAVVPGSFSETKTGTGIVATITFTSLLNTTVPSTSISLLDKSLVSGQARGQNVLIKTLGTKVVLNNVTQPAGTTQTQP
ncbi:hypothetical protein BH09PAT1_BH09PAT1_5720 [soil metagenome]